MKGMQELKKIKHDFACSHDSGVLTPEETTILTAFSDRMSTLTRLSEKWTEAEKSDPRKSYDHRLGALRTVKNELAAEKGLASERRAATHDAEDVRGARSREAAAADRPGECLRREMGVSHVTIRPRGGSEGLD